MTAGAGPRPRGVFIYTDAAVKPSPRGSAGAGYVIVFQKDGRWTTVVGIVPLRPQGNHEAEYEAAIIALDRAAKMFPPSTRVEVRVDSKLLADQWNDRSRTKDPQLQRLAQRLAKRVARFEKGLVTIERIPGNENRTAHLLSNAALAKSLLKVSATDG
jgi:ribonuclease HI